MNNAKGREKHSDERCSQPNTEASISATANTIASTQHALGPKQRHGPSVFKDNIHRHWRFLVARLHPEPDPLLVAEVGPAGRFVKGLGRDNARPMAPQLVGLGQQWIVGNDETIQAIAQIKFDRARQVVVVVMGAEASACCGM